MSYADALACEAQALRRLGDVGEACNQVRKAVEICRTRDPKTHVFLSKLLLLAECQSRQGNHEQAQGLVLHCSRASSKSGMGKSNAVVALELLAHFELAYNRPDPAKRYIDKALAIIREVEPNGGIRTAEILEGKAEILRLLKDDDQAETLIQDAKAIRSRLAKLRETVLAKLGDRLTASKTDTDQNRK